MTNDKQRERLMELLLADIDCGLSYCCDMCEYDYNDDDCFKHCTGKMADFLLANGVIVPRVKVGQTVWYVSKCAKRVMQIEVISYEIYGNGEEEFGCRGENFTPTRFKTEAIGKTVFLTREEAEKALTKVGNG